MQLDIYRDQALEKLLIVEERKDIHKLSIDDPVFLKGLKLTRTIDPDFNELPTGIDRGQVVEQVMRQGYFKTTFLPTLREIDG